MNGILCRPEYVEAQPDNLMLHALEGKTDLLAPELLARLQQQQAAVQQQEGAGRVRGKVAAEALRQLLSAPQVGLLLLLSLVVLVLLLLLVMVVMVVVLLLQLLVEERGSVQHVAASAGHMGGLCCGLGAGGWGLWAVGWGLC
jgi:uncharacterized membrane protein